MDCVRPVAENPAVVGEFVELGTCVTGNCGWVVGRSAVVVGWVVEGDPLNVDCTSVEDVVVCGCFEVESISGVVEARALVRCADVVDGSIEDATCVVGTLRITVWDTLAVFVDSVFCGSCVVPE